MSSRRIPGKRFSIKIERTLQHNWEREELLNSRLTQRCLEGRYFLGLAGLLEADGWNSQ